MADLVTFIAPLFGARCVEPVVVCDSMIVPSSWTDWEGVEQTDVVREDAGQHLALDWLGHEVGIDAPPCLVSVGESDDDWPEALAMGDDIVTALRLVGAVEFVDPSTVVRIKTSGGLIQRSVGPYRLSAYRWLTGDLDEIDQQVADSAELLVARMLQMDLVGVLEPIRSLCSPMLPPMPKVMLAMQLLEGVFGQIARPVHGLSFGERLAAVDLDPELVDWMDGPLGRGRAVRNTMAHGRAVAVDDADRIVEVALAAMLAFVMTDVDPDSSEDAVGRFRAAAFAQ